MGKNNKVNEERHAFELNRVFGSAPWMKPIEKQHHTTKVFKSGNSLAVRIPAGTKLSAGMEMDLVIEPMRFLLDTNIIVGLAINVDERVIRRAAECEAGDMVTSSIAIAEVAYGVEQGQPPTLEELRAFVEEVQVLDFDYKAALAYAQLPFKRASFDRLIAAHALSHGLTVVTRNEKDFADVPGLKLENWAV